MATRGLPSQARCNRAAVEILHALAVQLITNILIVQNVSLGATFSLGFKRSVAAEWELLGRRPVMQAKRSPRTAGAPKPVPLSQTEGVTLGFAGAQSIVGLHAKQLSSAHICLRSGAQ